MTAWISDLSGEHPSINGYEEFQAGSFDAEGYNRPVYKSGEGPAIIVIHEVPGIYDKVLDFARRLNNEGYTTYLPSLLGSPGKPLNVAYDLTNLAKVCIAKEFNQFALGKEAPIAVWLRALARHAHEECGGPGVGAVGMCFSGGFVLAMMADEHVIAPVMSQPSLPAAITPSLSGSCDINKEDISKIKSNLEAHDSCVLGLRFSHDRLVPKKRFKFLKDTFGERFEEVIIDSSIGNPHGNKIIAHSVLARDFVDDPEHPTYHALERVLKLFKQQLKS